MLILKSLLTIFNKFAFFPVANVKEKLRIVSFEEQKAGKQGNS